jgi:hypothetical protein
MSSFALYTGPEGVSRPRTKPEHGGVIAKGEEVALGQIIPKGLNCMILLFG